MQRVLEIGNGFIASRWCFRCRCSIRLLVSWLRCSKLRNNILGTVYLFYYLFALCCLVDFWSQLRCTYVYMLFNYFLLYLLYLVIQINVVYIVTMLKSTDDVLQKPIKNKLNIQTCPFTEFLLSYMIKFETGRCSCDEVHDHQRKESQIKGELLLINQMKDEHIPVLTSN